MSLSDGSMKDNKDGNRFKYKVYHVVNIKTGKVSRVAGAGMELPHETLRNLRLGCDCVRKNKKGETLKYERIL